MIYDIRLARVDEIDKIVYFIDHYWRHNHILAKNREILNFQHLDGQHYNMIIGYNTLTGEIDGMFCFIPVAFYDKMLEKEGNYWGALWKVRDDVKNLEIKNLAFQLITYILNLPYYRSYGGISLSVMAQAIMDPLFSVSGVMNQYYIANNRCTEFKIGKNLSKQFYLKGDAVIKEIDITEIKNAPQCTYEPKKSITFLVNRYLKHPIYRYNFWGIYKAGILISIWVIREVEIEGVVFLRIVDVLGNIENIGCVGEQVQKILQLKNAEYIDFMNYGIDEKYFESMGFIKLDLTSEDVIVPNYLEPYERRNVPINIACDADFDYVVFKADGDQDRPNIIK